MAVRDHKSKTYDAGLKAEKIAMKYLALKGYNILQERYKTAYGEIDIIAQKKNMIAFIEVKARQTKEQALESITPRMRKRICDAALFYVSQNDVADMNYRFDLITVTLPFSIQHVKNAWMMDT